MAKFLTFSLIMLYLLHLLVSTFPMAMARLLLDLETSSSSLAPGPGGADAPEMVRHMRHGSSVVGGAVILGGLGTAVVVAVFFYIRVTKKRNVLNK
ncbi:hypothetical protein IHE45_09G038100 [Dioscorea alata]|uniref:Uncharacterized protein n=1 Tax=Dioscorea alata TaxID=55571 RepID=A0ACB7VE54_DIOAL|nr:hypothetical protein IHE45_09G038100 [Dioscorea alata]